MTLNTAAIDRIVANVLSTLSPQVATAAPAADEQKSAVPASRLSEAVITAEHLEQCSLGQKIELSAKAIITPAAQDVIRDRQLQVYRISAGEKSASNSHTLPAINKLSAAIVRHTSAIAQALEETASVRKELVSCPDDAAKYAISEICRGEATSVLIFAEQTHRAACLANRNQKVKAVAVRDQADVVAVKKQLRANVWCFDPTDRSYFELRNIFKAITS